MDLSSTASLKSPLSSMNFSLATLEHAAAKLELPVIRSVLWDSASTSSGLTPTAILLYQVFLSAMLGVSATTSASMVISSLLDSTP